MIIITATFVLADPESSPEAVAKAIPLQQATSSLLYTSDAADDTPCVDI